MLSVPVVEVVLGSIVPPELTVTAPVVPVPPRVAPLLTVTGLASVVFTSSVPLLTVVLLTESEPVVRVRMLPNGPLWVMVPVPEMALAAVVEPDRSNTNESLSVTVPVPRLPVDPPLPIWRVVPLLIWVSPP